MRKTKRFPILLSLALAAILAACAGQPATPGVPTGEPTQPQTETPVLPETGGLENTSWNLVSFGPAGEETPVVEGSNVTLVFEEGRAGGQGGCNSYSGEYKLDGQQISFENVASTLKACIDEAVNQQEMDYFQALNQVNRFELNGENLTLFYADQGVLNFIRAQ
jgi:heat shock protein HslJ